ncbi:hypothetical protein [Marinifilum flexuosum]|uniref:hypothetical protein n=1 Tax=Marinifilum flexuosum TaxID=1117708 RepID=UPI00248FF9CD|nr:hypothetical protein [Marinifilum flexuosum]
MEENNNVVSAIYGQVAENRLHENLIVNKGDTLLILNVEKVDQDIATIKQRLELNLQYQEDLKSLLNGKSKTLITFLYQNELAEYNQKLIELDAEIKHKAKDYRINKELFEKEVVAKLEFEKIEYK